MEISDRIFVEEVIGISSKNKVKISTNRSKACF